MAVPKFPKKRDNLIFSHLVPNLPSTLRSENVTLPDVVHLNSSRTVSLKDHLWEEVASLLSCKKCSYQRAISQA